METRRAAEPDATRRGQLSGAASYLVPNGAAVARSVTPSTMMPTCRSLILSNRGRDESHAVAVRQFAAQPRQRRPQGQRARHSLASSTGRGRPLLATPDRVHGPLLRPRSCLRAADCSSVYPSDPRVAPDPTPPAQRHGMECDRLSDQPLDHAACGLAARLGTLGRDCDDHGSLGLEPLDIAQGQIDGVEQMRSLVRPPEHAGRRRAKLHRVLREADDRAARSPNEYNATWLNAASRSRNSATADRKYDPGRRRPTPVSTSTATCMGVLQRLDFQDGTVLAAFTDREVLSRESTDGAPSGPSTVTYTCFSASWGSHNARPRKTRVASSVTTADAASTKHGDYHLSLIVLVSPSKVTRKKGPPPRRRPCRPQLIDALASIRSRTAPTAERRASRCLRR